VSAARWLFIGGFAVILVSIVAFTFIAYRSMVRSTGSDRGSGEIVRRLGRLRGDRAEQATWAFLAHRVTGMAVFAFLALHLVDVSLFAFSTELYDDVHGLFATVPLRIFECGLLIAILFHTFNGLRILIVDLVDAKPATVHRSLTAVVVTTATLGALGSVVILAPVLS
jgi:succinate dehydrogenase / fumarate reductase cytochrome b subunit